jgi:hypothetical protein
LDGDDWLKIGPITAFCLNCCLLNSKKCEYLDRLSEPEEILGVNSSN